MRYIKEKKNRSNNISDRNKKIGDKNSRCIPRIAKKLEKENKED